MGRKNRNKICKEIDPTKDQQKQEDTELSLIQEQEDRIEKKYQSQISKDNIIWDIRRDMLEYCDDTAIPLCDYLTDDMFRDFVYYLIERS